MTQPRTPVEAKNHTKPKAKKIIAAKRESSGSYVSFPLSGDDLSEEDFERIHNKYWQLELSDPTEYLLIDLLMEAEASLTPIVRVSLYRGALEIDQAKKLDKVIDILQDVRMLQNAISGSDPTSEPLRMAKSATGVTPCH